MDIIRLKGRRLNKRDKEGRDAVRRPKQECEVIVEGANKGCGKA